MPLNILVIEDSKADFMMLERNLKQNNLSASCRRVDSLEGVKEAIANEKWDLVLSDYSIPKLNFLDSLNLVQLAHPNLPVIMVSGMVGEELAVEFLKLGVKDFVLKENLPRLVPAIQRALKEKIELEELRRTQESLRESETMYRSLFENMLNGFALCKMIFEDDTPQDFIYLRVNKAFEKQTGLKDVIGKRVSEVIPNIRETDNRLIEIYGRVALTGNPEQFEIYLNALKQWFWISAYCPAKDHFVSVFDVITERKEAEKALAMSEERFQLAMQGANDGLWDWNLKTNELYYSPRWKSMLGYADEELANHYDSWEQLLHPDDLKPALKQLHDFLGGRIAKFKIEFRMRHKEGHYVDILSRAFLVQSDQEEAMRLVGTHVDVTERRKLEAQYLQAQKMESVGRLAGGVAHDFNNMLTVIVGYSELVLSKFDPTDEIHEHLSEIHKAGVRSTEITRQLLTFARRQTIQPVVLNLNNAVNGMLKMLKRLIGEDIDLAWLPGTDVLQVKMDPSQLDQLLANLCVNARDAIDGVGKITIETDIATFDEAYCADHTGFVPGEYVVLSVSDDGCGMDHETVGKIFEPFFTTKAVGQGTGLGLSTVYGIVKQNKGFINVYSEPGEGTNFKIYLTRHANLTLEPPKENLADIFVGHGEIILIVEDEVSILMLTKTILEKLEYTVLTAEKPSDAIRLSEEHQKNIDLLITDIVMPEMNGKELSNKLCKKFPALRTIFMSGYTANAIAHRGVLDAGVNYIQKPFSQKSLAAKVKEVLLD